MRRLADRYLAAVAQLQPDDEAPDPLPVVLAKACVEVLPVDGAGLSLTERLRVPLGASDGAAARAERLQATLDGGPCLGAMRAGRPIAADEQAAAARWPRYHRELTRQTPYRSVASLPLRVAHQAPVGALDLTAPRPGWIPTSPPPRPRPGSPTRSSPCCWRSPWWA